MVNKMNVKGLVIQKYIGNEIMPKWYNVGMKY